MYADRLLELSVGTLSNIISVTVGILSDITFRQCLADQMKELPSVWVKRLKEPLSVWADRPIQLPVSVGRFVRVMSVWADRLLEFSSM